jgi:hypothetical protein
MADKRHLEKLGAAEPRFLAKLQGTRAEFSNMTAFISYSHLDREYGGQSEEGPQGV